MKLQEISLITDENEKFDKLDVSNGTIIKFRMTKKDTNLFRNDIWKVIERIDNDEQHGYLLNNIIRKRETLFFDDKLSYNQTKSCASCHDPQFAFTDGYRKSVGADGENLRRNAPSILNTTYLKALTWGDSSIHAFSQQLIFPLFNEHPKELGWTSNELEIINRFKQDPFYQTLFSKAFPKEKNHFSTGFFLEAISAFENQLESLNSPYDQYLKGNKTAMNEKAIKGLALFNSTKLSCFKCHSLNVTQQPLLYANTGLYNLNEDGSYPASDQGLYEITKNTNDKGKFRVPSLRNILITAPYGHDGSVETIQQMIYIYQRGGRLIEGKENKGDGRFNKNKSSLINGFTLTDEEQVELIEFLAALTDTSYLRNKQLMNPFN
jgi:cytochrome c peroxidase